MLQRDEPPLNIVLPQYPPGTICPPSMKQRVLLPHGNAACLQETSPPTPPLALPPHGDIAPWPMPFLSAWQCVLLTLGDVVPRPTPTLPTLQLVPPTLGNVVPWPMPTLPMLQNVLHTLGDLVPLPTPTLPNPFVANAAARASARDLSANTTVGSADLANAFALAAATYRHCSSVSTAHA